MKHYKIKKISYRISYWLIPTALIMMMLSGLTINRVRAADVIFATDQLTAAETINPTDLVTLTNQERLKYQLTPLITSPLLTQAAQAKAEDMREKDYFEHFRPSDSKTPWAFIEEAGFDWQIAGENLARGFSNNSQIVAAWMESSTHRKNILNPNYQEVGIATVQGIKNGQPIAITVQMFGASR